MKELELLNIEFYQEPSGEVIVRPRSGGTFLLAERNREFIVPMKILLQSDYAEAYKACEAMHEKSRPNRVYFDFLCVRQFLKCNFSQFDNVDDIDSSGRFHFEYISCPLRGTCKYQNIICNPKFTTTLTKSDIAIMRMIVAQHMTADQIALSLSRSINTINTRRRTILRKTGCQNIAGLVAYCYEHNII